VTRYNPETLRAASGAAGGTFIGAEETDKAGKVRRALSELRAEQRAIDGSRELTPRFQLFLFPALLLPVADTLLAERRGRRGRRTSRSSRAPAAASLLFALLGPLLGPQLGCAGGLDEAAELYRRKQYARAAAAYRAAVNDGDRSPRTLYNLGTALLSADSLAPAAEALERATTAPDEDVRYRALFNLGLAQLRRGLAAQGEEARPALDAALASYRKALLLRSNEVDAKWNYELALRQQQSGGGGGGGGGGEDEQSPSAPDPAGAQSPAEQPSGGLGRQRAEELLNSAARDERDVQGKKQKQNHAATPPGGKDW